MRHLSPLEREEMELQSCPRERGRRLRAARVHALQFDGQTGARISYDLDDLPDELPEGIEDYLLQSER
jgi:hypothetical protein